MFKQLFLTFPAVVAVAASGVPAKAGETPLQVTSKIFVELNKQAADGTVRTDLVPARKAVPGDRVVFVLAYRNVGSQPIEKIVFANPLPTGVAYRAPAQGSVAPELSVDGMTYGALAQLRIRDPQGGIRPARADDVTHVRWQLAGSLVPQAKGQFAFQAVLK